MKKILLFLLGITVLSTCTKDTYTPDICFTENVLPIFVSSCTMSNCHNSTDRRAGYDLSTYEGIMKGIKAGHPLTSEIYGTIRGKNSSMPQSPYPKLSPEDITTIRIWIKMGAPNSSNCSTCDTTDFTFHTRINPVIQLWCVGCHEPGNQGGGIDLSTYSGVVSAISNNKLSGSINHLPGFSAMPKNTSKLSSCEINAIEKWLLAGNPDN